MPIIPLLTFLMLILISNVSGQSTEKRRVVVLTDIEADPDDAQSLVRFLLYSGHWDTEALIATTSIHQKNRVEPGSIQKILDAYAKVQPNLLLHEKGFPEAKDLKAIVKKGLPVYGMDGVGKGKDSEGSDFLLKLLEKKDDRPVWVSVWGGINCLAQTLWKIKETKTAHEAEKLYKKLRVYTISDQDDAGPWIRKNFPSIFYVVTPGYNYTYATWLGMSMALPGSNADVVSAEWLANHIQQGKGPLGAAYPDVAYGMEGDSPAFLSLIENGLNTPENPDFGGWGGRYEYYLPEFKDSNTGRFKRENWPSDLPETRPVWTNASDSVVSAMDKKIYAGNRETIWRWRQDYQEDFAGRMLWCTKKYTEANHPPVPGLTHADRITLKSGQEFRLDASGSVDPDGDSMSYLWFQYLEAGSYKGKVGHAPYAANLVSVPVVAPKVAKPETVHYILRVKDKGTPVMTRYKRIILTIVP